MYSCLRIAFVLLVWTLTGLSLSAGGMLKSGPQKDELLPGPFHPMNINGPFGKSMPNGVPQQGRYHSLICEYGLRPVVMVLAREREDGKDETLLKLLKELDQAVKEDENSALRAFAAFLSPQAQSSVTEAAVDDKGKTTDPFQLNTEAVARDKLIQRLEARAMGLENVILAAYPLPGPPAYNLSDKAEITVLLYHRQKVLANFAFAPDQLTDANVTEIIDQVRNTVGLKKKAN